MAGMESFPERLGPALESGRASQSYYYSAAGFAAPDSSPRR